MSAAAAQLQFAAEFVGFLAAAAGVALVVVRADLAGRSWWAQTALGAGFLALAGAAFAHGSLLVSDERYAAIASVRAAGILSVAVGAVWWRSTGASRRLLVAGLLATSVATALAGSNSAHTTVVDICLAVGGAAIGGALLVASRRQIAARVAASAAGTLLIVVLVLSVALSAVVSNSSEDEALRRLDSRTRTIVANAENTALDDSLRNSRFAAAYLRLDDPLHSNLLTQLARAGSGPLPPDQFVGTDLTNLADLFKGFFNLAYLTPGGRVYATDPSFAPGVAVQLPGQDLFRQTHCGSDASAIVTIGSAAFAAGSTPLCTAQSTIVGVVVAVTPFDASFLARRVESDEALSLGLFSRDVEVSHTDPSPPLALAKSMTAGVLDTAVPVSRVTTSLFVTALPITAAGQPVLVLVGATPTSAVTATRDKLFRTLFLIALGGTLLALLLAAVVGDRIGAGLRRLTAAAERIQRGERGTRAGITSVDEVGVLGAAFDSMVASIEEKTEALSDAADDETRLRNRLEAVVAGMSDALIAVDASGQVTDFNQTAEELSGVSAADARGKAATEVLYLVDEGGGGLAGRLSSPSPMRWSAIASLIQPDGTNVPVAVSSGVLRGANFELVGNVYVLRDLRREREMERMKTEFLSRVGHELRTPLTGILGYSEMLTRRQVPPDRGRVFLEEIVSASKRLLRIVEMVEFFASSTAGRAVLRPEPLDVRPVVDEAVDRWSERVDGHHSVVRRIARGTPSVNADRRWLGMAIDELIDNAVKFSPAGERVLVTAGQAGNGHGPGVEISVADRGKGMSNEEQDAAFGEFVQGDSSDTRPFGGLGLGLALVKRVAEGHGGSVSCLSRPGRGSSFTIFLPTLLATSPPTTDGDQP
jgi:PAS domain S-box-containing protein